MRALRLFLLALSGGLLCAALAGAIPGPASAQAAASAPGLPQAAAEALQASGAPGLAVAVYTPGRGLELAAAGTADLGSGTPVRPDDLFCIGSITKTFVAVCILQLVDEGRLALDQPAAELWADPKLDRRITVRQLLNHSSGIYDFQDLQGRLPRWMLALALTRDYSPEQVARFCLEQKPYFAPGTGHHYSNANYFILGLILEGLENRPLGETINARVLDPLELRHTYFGGSDGLPASAMHGYGLTRGVREDRTAWENPSLAWAAGAMVSNAPDLIAFARGLFEGRLLPPALLAEMRTGIERPRNGKYGLGLMLVPAAAGEVEGHEGMTLGFRAGLWHLREPDAYAVVLANQVDCNAFAAYEAVLAYATGAE